MVNKSFVKAGDEIFKVPSVMFPVENSSGTVMLNSIASVWLNCSTKFVLLALKFVPLSLNANETFVRSAFPLFVMLNDLVCVELSLADPNSISEKPTLASYVGVTFMLKDIVSEFDAFEF